MDINRTVFLFDVWRFLFGRFVGVLVALGAVGLFFSLCLMFRLLFFTRLFILLTSFAYRRFEILYIMNTPVLYLV